MSSQTPVLLTSLISPPSDAPVSGAVTATSMAPLIAAMKEHIERLEAENERIRAEAAHLRMRIADLEEQLYRNDRLRIKFDDEST